VASRRTWRQQWSNPLPQVIRHKIIRHVQHSAARPPQLPSPRAELILK
jgi:hypothetical protein